MSNISFSSLKKEFILYVEKNSLKLSSILIIIAVFSCFFPLIHLENTKFGLHIHKDMLQLSEQYILSTNAFRDWLLVSLVISIPLFINLLLDYKNIFPDYDFKSRQSEWLSRFKLLFWLNVPNLILQIFIMADNSCEDAKSSCILNNEVLLCIYLGQYIAVVGNMLSSMYGHNKDRSRKLKGGEIILEVRFVIMSALFILGKLIIFASTYSSSVLSNILDPIGYLFVAASTALLFQTLIMLLYALKINMKNSQFISHHHMADFWYAVALLLFVTCNTTLVLVIYSTSGSNQSNLFIIFNWLNIMLMIFLIVLPARKFQMSSNIKKKKLANRLDMIRYLSHEMRTPLNTSLMGIDIAYTEVLSISNDIRNLQESIKEFQSVNQSSRSKVDFSSLTKWIEDQVDKLPELLQTLMFVNESCRVSLSTLDDLLTFDKLDENRLVIELDDIKPWEFIKQTVSPFEINAKMSDIDLRLFSTQLKKDVFANKDSTEGMFLIRADEFKLSQVLRNLISNAIKFTPPQGQVTISVDILNVNNIVDDDQVDDSEDTGSSKERESSGKPKLEMTKSISFFRKTLHQTKSRRLSRGESFAVIFSSKASAVELDLDDIQVDWLRVSVKDSGPGISKENQKKLFGQYVQFDASKLQKGKGSGLGLWISKKIIELHGGFIDVYSEGEGHGSIFSFFIPIYKIKDIKNLSKVSSLSASNLSLPNPIENMEKNMPLKKKSYEFRFSRRRSKTEYNRIHIDELESIVSQQSIRSIRSHRSNRSNPSVRSIHSAHSAHSNKSNGSSHHSLEDVEDPKKESTDTEYALDNYPSNLHLAATKVAKLGNQPKKPSYEKDLNFCLSYFETNAKINQSSRNFFVRDSMEVKKEELNVILEEPHLDHYSIGLNIIIVDDVLMNRKITAKALRNQGHRVVEASDGENCLELFDRIVKKKIFPEENFKRLDMILMDDIMPRMTGCECAQILRKPPYSYDGVILGLTGNTQEDQILDFKRHGVNDVLIKPLNMEAMKNIYNRIVNNQTRLI